MEHRYSSSRRLALKRGGLGMLALVAAAVVPWRRARATEHLPRASEDDATAKQLQYVHDASDAAGDRGANELCNNCRYYKGGADDAWAGCDVFPGKLVNGQGWCNVWAAKS